MVLEPTGDLDHPLGQAAISPAGHRVPFLRTAARFMGGIDGCVLIRSSNPAVFVPDLRTAVREGRNVAGFVLVRSASSIVGALWGAYQPSRAH